MGRDHHRNQSTDGLVILLMKAHHDLAAVQFKLEKEFQQTYPENANPVKLVNRIKKMQEEVSGLKEQCRELLAAKQELVDKARSIMLGNNNVIQRMQVSTGISPTTVDDPAFADFNQVIDEWSTQVRSRTGKKFKLFPPSLLNLLPLSTMDKLRNSSC
ncbi:unnamed protein product [Linum tenue]|uniref:Protein FAM33A n=1 Tax=Linum tenue TaxID=586396 RepID=A0AAV0LVL9_9ROSI|nr:unnamed protein product [Linum tenue]